MTSKSERPSAEVRIRAMKRDRFRCTYCGVPGTDAELEIDHIIPIAKGGSNHISNLTTACRSCNQTKGVDDMTPQWVESKRQNNNYSTPGGLVGMWLHTLVDAEDGGEEKEIDWQGHITGIHDSVALVQLFSWFTGSPTRTACIPINDILDAGKCALYESRDKMDSVHERYIQKEEKRERRGDRKERAETVE